MCYLAGGKRAPLAFVFESVLALSRLPAPRRPAARQSARGYNFLGNARIMYVRVDRGTERVTE